MTSISNLSPFSTLRSAIIPVSVTNFIFQTSTPTGLKRDFFCPKNLKYPDWASKWRWRSLEELAWIQINQRTNSDHLIICGSLNKDLLKIFAQLGPTIFEVWVEFDIKLISLFRSARSHHTCARHKLYFPNLHSNWSWEGLFLPKELEISWLGFQIFAVENWRRSHGLK